MFESLYEWRGWSSWWWTTYTFIMGRVKIKIDNDDPTSSVKKKLLKRVMNVFNLFFFFWEENPKIYCTYLDIVWLYISIPTGVSQEKIHKTLMSVQNKIQSFLCLGSNTMCIMRGSRVSQPSHNDGGRILLSQQCNPRKFLTIKYRYYAYIPLRTV